MFQGFTSAEAVRLYSVVENKLSYNDPISDSGQQSDFLKINQISSRLPLLFYDEDTREAAIIDPGCMVRSEEARLKAFIDEEGLTPQLLLCTH